MHSQPGRRVDRGFTLIEIMVVIAILGLLATMVAANVIRHHDDAMTTKATVDVKTIVDAAKTFYLQQHRMPTWAELTEPDRNGHVWLEAASDPWHHDYVLVAGDTPGTLTVRCSGPDGVEGTEDDIVATVR